MKITTDERNFVKVEEAGGLVFPLPMRVDPGAGVIEFKDKDHRRSAARGSDYVYLTIGELIDFLEEILSGVDSGGQIG